MARPVARRFLLPGAGKGSTSLGYTSKPIRELPVVADEPEVVERIRGATDTRDELESLDADDYKRHIDPDAIMREGQRLKFETAQRERDRRLMDFEQRLVTAHEEARRRCIDVSSEVRLLRHMQQSGKQVRHLEQRLGAVERKVWRDQEAA